MGFLALFCTMLTVMSYFSATCNSFHREITLQVNNFSSPFFCLGITFEDMGCDDQMVHCVTIGLLVVNIKLMSYKHTEGTLREQPWLDNDNVIPSWQRFIQRFMYSLDLPIPWKKKAS